jgi:hypothetical protein
MTGLQLGLAALILAASGATNAQYFFRYDVLPSTTVACNADSADVGPGTISFSVPPGPNNVVIVATFNGVPQPPDIQTQDPPLSQTLVNEPTHIGPLGSPGTPYAIELSAFPAVNGNPVGTGIGIRVQCNTLGPSAGVATFSVVQAPSMAIPATSRHGLIALSVLLACAATWQFRRRRA